MVYPHRMFGIIVMCLLTVFGNSMSKELEKSDLEIACEQAIQQDNIEALRTLYLDAIKKLPADDRYEMERQRGNVLTYAAFFGHEQVLVDLLARNFDPNDHSYYGSCALLYAIGQGRIKIIQILLEAGADVEACNGYGESTVSVAKMFPIKVIREKILDILRMYNAVIEEEKQL